MNVTLESDKPTPDGFTYHMLAFVLRRLAHALAIVLIATIASFVPLQLAPGDPLLTTGDLRVSSAEQRAVARAAQGLDRPVPEHLLEYVTRVSRGDFGQSTIEQRRVSSVLGEALPRTLLLSSAGLLLATLLGMAIGTFEGWRPHDAVASRLGAVLTALYAIPEVVLAIALLATFGLVLGLFPVGTMADPMIELTRGWFERVRDRAWHLALPATTLAMAWGAAIARQQRASMRRMANEHFVRTARAKGAPAHRVLLVHALRPALPSSVALLGTMIPVLVGGTVIVETLFSWPGMGSLIVRAVSLRDYPLVAGAVILVATTVAIGSLVSDLAVRVLDPRADDDARG